MYDYHECEYLPYGIKIRIFEYGVYLQSNDNDHEIQIQVCPFCGKRLTEYVYNKKHNAFSLSSE